MCDVCSAGSEEQRSALTRSLDGSWPSLTRAWAELQVWVLPEGVSGLEDWFSGFGAAKLDSESVLECGGIGGSLGAAGGP